VKVVLIRWRLSVPVAKTPVDVTPADVSPVDVTQQIEKRAYELFEQHGRHDGQAVKDWEQAEQEIRKDKPGK
jgi:hypothetical protein